MNTIKILYCTIYSVNKSIFEKVKKKKRALYCIVFDYVR